jgi:ABC-type sugar transport system ATPase subunit
VRISHPAAAKKSSMGFVPVDRKEEGVAIDMDVKTNIVAANIENLGKGMRINKKMEEEHAENGLTRWA